MPSNTDIANMALVRLGQKPISALDEDSDAARLVSNIFESVRDSTLEAADWAFAIKRAELSQSAEAPAYGFTYYYILPSDCLRVIETDDPDYEYEIEGGKLASDADSVSIKYIARVTNPNQFSKLFIEVFVQRLMAELCHAMTDKQSLATQHWNLYMLKLKEARCLNNLNLPTRKKTSQTISEVR